VRSVDIVGGVFPLICNVEASRFTVVVGGSEGKVSSSGDDC